MAAINSLQRERKNSPFDVKKMTEFLFEGAENLKIYEKLALQIQRDPVFLDDLFDVPPKQQREIVYRRVRRLMEYRQQEDASTYDMRQKIVSVLDPATDVRIGVHTVLFREAIAQNGTPEQVAKLLPDIDAYRLPGCFAMTEMGHGSYIQGCETTATFCKETDSFIINTPYETATKWWIGGAAHSVVACACYARLIINGKDHGVYVFFVPLRRKEDFSLLPGVVIGDCGTKMGRAGIDNGWIQFSNVRIPRSNMLMRWAKVDREGNLTESPMIQLSYISLVHGRVSVTSRTALQCKKALTIATRYGAARRQFQSTSGDREEQLLNYTTHMYRLFPLLAETYAWHFGSIELENVARQVSTDMHKGDISGLNTLHGVSSCMKACATWFGMDCIEQSRQCLGGHGYSAYAALAQALNDHAVQCSWEGDNTVMMLQSARYLVKSLQAALKGKTPTSDLAFLAHAPQLLQSKLAATTAEQLKDASNIIKCFEYITTKALVDAAQKMMALEKSGKNKEEAWNECAVELKAAAENYNYLYLANVFNKHIQYAPDTNTLTALTKLFQLFGLYKLSAKASTLLEGGFINSKQAAMLRSEVLNLCREIRPMAIPLTDSFHLADFMLRSPFGKYDGDIYQAYFDRVKSAPDCQTHPPYYFDALIKPTIHRSGVTKSEYDLTSTIK